MIYVLIVFIVLVVLLVIAFLGAKADYEDAELYKCPADGADLAFD